MADRFVNGEGLLKPNGELSGMSASHCWQCSMPVGEDTISCPLCGASLSAATTTPAVAPGTLVTPVGTTAQIAPVPASPAAASPPATTERGDTHCPRCSHPLADGLTLCPLCGAEVVGRTPIAPVVKPPRMSPAHAQFLSSVIILVLLSLIVVMMVGMRLQNTGVGSPPPPGSSPGQVAPTPEASPAPVPPVAAPEAPPPPPPPPPSGNR